MKSQNSVSEEPVEWMGKFLLREQQREREGERVVVLENPESNSSNGLSIVNGLKLLN